jgi:hypothetical protein
MILAITLPRLWFLLPVMVWDWAFTSATEKYHLDYMFYPYTVFYKNRKIFYFTWKMCYRKKSDIWSNFTAGMYQTNVINIWLNFGFDSEEKKIPQDFITELYFIGTALTSIGSFIDWHHHFCLHRRRSENINLPRWKHIFCKLNN